MKKKEPAVTVIRLAFSKQQGVPGRIIKERNSIAKVRLYKDKSGQGKCDGKKRYYDETEMVLRLSCDITATVELNEKNG